jgi:translation initiation factor 2 subunit 1
MRFYEKIYPSPEECVMVRVDSVSENGAYVSLLEYNGLGGLIQFNEISRRKIKSINNIIRVGKTEVCLVLRVDTIKGFIDLSKRRVNPEDIVQLEERYSRGKTVQSILQHVADVTHCDLEDLCKRISWPLYRKFKHAFTAFQLCLRESDKIFEDVKFPSDLVKKSLLATIEQRLKPKPTKIRADIEVCCFTRDGIDGVKKILNEGMKNSTFEIPIRIQLISPPLYVILTNTIDVKAGIGLIQKCLDEMMVLSRQIGARCVVKTMAREVSAKEDHSLNLLLEQLREDRESLDSDENTTDEEEEEEFIGL